MLFCQSLFAKTLKFFISAMAFKEIRQTLASYLSKLVELLSLKIDSFVHFLIKA